MFTFKEIIGAVKVANRSVAFYDVVTVEEEMFHILVEVVIENIQMPENMLVVKIAFHAIVSVDLVICTPLGTGVKDSAISQEPIDIITGKGDLPVCKNRIEEFFQIQCLINLLQHKVTDVFHLGSGSDISGSDELLIEINFELDLSLAFLVLLIVFCYLLLSVSQRIIRDGKQFGVLSDPLDVLGRHFFSITNALLDEIGGVLGLPVIIELHTQHPPQ